MIAAMVCVGNDTFFDVGRTLKSAVVHKMLEFIPYTDDSTTGGCTRGEG